MIPRITTTRYHLLPRELSFSRALPLRSINTTRQSLLRAQQAPCSPIRPPPPSSSSSSSLPDSISPQYQQKTAAASKALQDLSHLTPSQITTLLTAPPVHHHQQHHHPNHQQPPPKPPLLSPRFRRVLWALLFFALGYKITDEQLQMIRFLVPYTHEPFGPLTPEQKNLIHHKATTAFLHEHPLFRSMLPTQVVNSEGKLDVRPSGWEVWEPYGDFSDDRRAKHLCAGTLNHPDALGVTHAIFRHMLTGELVELIVFGECTSGWPGVVHGGMLATIMDEALGRLAAQTFPANTAVTAKLLMEYKQPVSPGAPYTVRVNKVLPELQKSSPNEEDKTDRKLYVHGRMEDINGELVVESTALFVVPKGIDIEPMGKRF